jgi:hypothetical protein
MGMKSSRPQKKTHRLLYASSEVTVDVPALKRLQPHNGGKVSKLQKGGIVKKLLAIAIMMLMIAYIVWSME